MFFHRCSYSNSCFGVGVQLQCICANLMICSLKFKKNVFILKMLLWIVFLVFKLCSIQVVISLPLWIKLTMAQLLLFFSAKLQQVFQLRRKCSCNQPFFTVIDCQVYFGYLANYNTHRAFTILFLICSGLLNFLRSFGIMVTTTESY